MKSYKKCMGCNKIGQDDHLCPFKEEVNNDEKSLCNCCEECTHDCLMDV